MPHLRPHPLDQLMARLSARSKLFSLGWGDESVLSSSPPAGAVYAPSIEIEWSAGRHTKHGQSRDGQFRSPSELLPAECKMAHVRAITKPGNTSACVVLAASRDEGYRAREYLFGPLVEQGIDLYLLENPYYGLRRTQSGPSLATVSDQIIMTRATVFEACALLNYIAASYSRLAVAGYSMGGHMASLTASRYPAPIACAALATGASASAIFTKGLLSLSVDFAALAEPSEDLESVHRRFQNLFDRADLTQNPLPLRPDAAVIVGAERDGYVLPCESARLHEYWAGSDLRWVRAGHFSALLSCRRALREAVADAVRRLAA